MKPRLAIIAHVNILRERVVNSVFSASVRPLQAYRSGSYPLGPIALWLLTTSLTLLAQPADAHGTALFVIRTPKEIVVAADSREIALQTHTTSPDPVCKIRVFGDAFVVISGMVSDSRSNFFALAIVDQAGNADRSLQWRIAMFEELVKGPLEKALQRIKWEDPVAYQEYVTTPLGIRFLGVEEGELVLYNRRFPVNDSIPNAVTVNIERRRCPGTDCPTGIVAVYVQPPKATFYTRLRQEFAGFEKGQGNLAEVARRFVQMQIDARLPNVGPPIDLLRVTKNGPEWICQKPECDKEGKGKPCPPPAVQQKPAPPEMQPEVNQGDTRILHITSLPMDVRAVGIISVITVLFLVGRHFWKR
ncbi:MAG: hypothetical protein LC776_03275 [Acidobacteria bacterium]|nr:hypothetical protein [Acidobacteriota bacterium]